MYLTRLSLSNFRNYADLLLVPDDGFVILTGENGAGKTNILEAISLLAPGRGMRGASLIELGRTEGPKGFGVAASFGDVDLATGTFPNAPERRVVKINGAHKSANALAEWLSVIWLTPAMDRLFVEAASSRRRFLDRLALALSPAHASHANRYEAAMRQRNRLLADWPRVDQAWLSALEGQMAEHGQALARARTELVQKLEVALDATPEGPFARATLSLSDEAETPAYIADALHQNRARDAAAGRTLTGPHRTDLLVTHRGKNQPASQCSTGEQKALLLGLLLAHTGLVSSLRQHRPILLFDEVAAHIDPVRRRALFEQLAATSCQVWMTGTEAGLFSDILTTATHAIIDNGTLRRER